MRVAVMGGVGDVGLGIVRRFLTAGAEVIAVSRQPGRAQSLLAELPRPENLSVLVADLQDADATTRLSEAIGDRSLDAVIVSVHVPVPEKPLLNWDPDELSTMLGRNLLPHFNSAKAFLPAMSPGSTFLGIGGGTADYLIPGIYSMSLAQAAQRMMYRALAKEISSAGVRVRELIVRSMVNGHSSRSWAKPEWLTEDEIGTRVVDIVTNPDKYPETVLEMSAADRPGL